jgi:hypothetical protein
VIKDHVTEHVDHKDHNHDPSDPDDPREQRFYIRLGRHPLDRSFVLNSNNSMPVRSY